MEGKLQHWDYAAIIHQACFTHQAGTKAEGLAQEGEKASAALMQLSALRLRL